MKFKPEDFTFKLNDKYLKTLPNDLQESLATVLFTQMAEQANAKLAPFLAEFEAIKAELEKLKAEIAAAPTVYSKVGGFHTVYECDWTATQFNEANIQAKVVQFEEPQFKKEKK